MEASKHQLDSVLVEQIILAVKDAANQVCHGSYSEAEVDSFVRSTISFPNKGDNDLNGKPHNVELRIALKMFHQTRKHKAKEQPAGCIELTSDLGLTRCLHSPTELAQVLCQVLNQEWDVRVSSSGILCLVTARRSQALRQHGRLPCPKCIQWCKGEKGLWWHQQQAHGSDHSVATEHSASERTILALVPYDPQYVPSVGIPIGIRVTTRTEDDNVFECARRGNLEALQIFVQDGNNLADMWDRKGASPLHWAAGSGQLAVIRFLINNCQCDVDAGQRGKRSFSGRTALHWAARNGHLDVVKYLVEQCCANLDATTIDGTTAFGWACWQGHLEIMKYLHSKECDIHKTNLFGCNAVLWCSQGEGNRLEAMLWLHSSGCQMSLVNENGHGALHKAAQRGRADLVEWLVTNVSDGVSYAWIGPDADGCCPSDLAGMEGHGELAEKLVELEAQLATKFHHQQMDELPHWLDQSGSKPHGGKYASNVWEAWGGTRRLQKHLAERMF